MTRRRLMTWSAVAALVGGLGFVVVLIIDPTQAWFAYLAAAFATVTVALGAMAMVLAAHLSGAIWFVVLRRLAEAAAATIPIASLLLVPLAFGLYDLYPWLTPSELPPHAQTIVERKLAYLNLPFFAIRAVVYVGVWIGIAAMLARWSARQDEGRPAGSIRGASAVAAILLGFTLSFASIDWVMSLTPAWASTVYGVRVFAGAMVGGVALVALLAGAGGLPLNPAHGNALASLLISALLFWAYIAFSQLLVIWIGNEPLSIEWYLARATGGWLAVAVVLGAGHFLIPFLLLLVRPIRLDVRALAWIGLLLLAMHALDVWWLVVPALPGASWPAVLAGVGALLFTGGAACAASAWFLAGRPLMPAGDPALPRSLAYEERS